MPALLPIVLTASHLVLAANSIPKFDLERTCRPAAEAAEMPGRDSAACQREERDARSKLEQDWAQYNAAQKKPVRRLRRTRSRTELRGVAHLPGNGKASAGASARFESGHRRPQVTLGFLSRRIAIRTGGRALHLRQLVCRQLLGFVLIGLWLLFFLRRTHLTFRHNDLP